MTRHLDMTAWSAKDVDRYFAFCDGAYAPSGSAHAAWVEERKRRVGKDGAIEVRIENVNVSAPEPDTVEVSFDWADTSDDHRDRVAKMQVWKCTGAQWLIVSGRMP